MEEGQSSSRRRLLLGTITALPMTLSGCLGFFSTNESPSTGQSESETTSPQNAGDTNDSLFSDYGVAGNEFVVELNPDRSQDVTTLVLRYNDADPQSHPRQQVEGISTARFDLTEHSRVPPQEGTWTIEALDDDGKIGTAEFEAERELSLSEIGTVSQTGELENTQGIEVGDIQFGLTNSGDIPTVPYTLEFNTEFNDREEIGGMNVALGMESENQTPLIVSGDTIRFRMSSLLCFEQEEDAEEWVNQTAQASLIANAGEVSESWTFPLTVNFGSPARSGGDLSFCIENTEVVVRE